MRVETIARVSAFALVVAGTSILAAPQQTTRTPGKMTEAHVWVQNRGRGEAVSVDLRDVNLDSPLKVQITNADAQYPRTGAVNAKKAGWKVEEFIGKKVKVEGNPTRKEGGTALAAGVITFPDGKVVCLGGCPGGPATE